MVKPGLFVPAGFLWWLAGVVFGASVAAGVTLLASGYGNGILLLPVAVVIGVLTALFALGPPE